MARSLLKKSYNEPKEEEYLLEHDQWLQEDGSQLADVPPSEETPK